MNTKKNQKDHFAQMSSSKNHFSNFNNSLSNDTLVYKLNYRIRSLRISRGWSQSELGKRLGNYMNLDKNIPTSTISSWENKNITLAKIPSPDKIEALSHVFHVTIDYLKGLSDDPHKNAIEFISNQSSITNIDIIPQELPQYFGKPIWIKNSEYNGWMLLCEDFSFIDCKSNKYTVNNLLEKDSSFSVFPPCNVFFKQIYNRFIIPETQIRNYHDKMWVCINSPDSSLQNLNGWYIRTTDGIGVKGKTFLSFDSYFDLWIAYTTPLDD